jgi:hypothetical protein
MYRSSEAISHQCHSNAECQNHLALNAAPLARIDRLKIRDSTVCKVILGISILAVSWLAEMYTPVPLRYSSRMKVSATTSSISWGMLKKVVS